MPDSAKKTVVVIDDDELLCMSVKAFLADRRLTVLTANTAADGLALCAQGRADAVILDHQLPDAKGADLCEPILSYNDRTKIIFVTAFPSFDNAVKALKAGAHDYLSKPFEPDALGVALDNALHTAGLEQVAQVQHYKSRIERQESVLIGNDSSLGEVRRMLTLAGGTDAPVLITGETGTGKSLVARCIHYAGTKDPSAFIACNCAALPENLIEAELFGHAKGAFTGAVAARKGIFAMASDGTLFLDEIGELPFALQSKLLGVLDDGRFRPLGDQQSRRVEARIIAATNLDVEAAVEAKRFRQDLYYRFSVLRIHLPPLRERLADLEALCAHFLAALVPDGGVKLAPNEIARLARYPWPGNVRELKNVLERAVILRRGDAVRPSQLLADQPLPALAGEPGQNAPPLMPLDEVVRRAIIEAVERFEGNHTQAARALGISRSTLIRKLNSYHSQ
jgi:DNA-binding NtrC family response regulator